MKIPEWQQISHKIDMVTGDWLVPITPLELFIYNHEPEPSDYYGWRQDLQALVDSLIPDPDDLTTLSNFARDLRVFTSVVTQDTDIPEDAISNSMVAVSVNQLAKIAEVIERATALYQK